MSKSSLPSQGFLCLFLEKTEQTPINGILFKDNPSASGLNPHKH